jgi:6-aminohexanoate-oligomer endohydrolase
MAVKPIRQRGNDMTITNDNLQLVSNTALPSENVLQFDFPALRIGIAEYLQGPTGCTVFYFPDGVKTAVDIRGGYPGLSFQYEFNHAICFAGGSLLGLEVVAGVSAEIFATRGYSFEEGFPLASGAILYDFTNRDNQIYPDLLLGRDALKTAQPGKFPIGAYGAGRNVSVGGTFDDSWREVSGQGGAVREVGPVKVAVFTVVNASGSVHDRAGVVVRGNYESEARVRHKAVDDLERRLVLKERDQPRQGNTTLTLVVTNLKLSQQELTQVGRQVHSSMARAIQPFATMDDGDVLYAVTTDEVEYIGATSLGLIASEVAWDAILSIYPS